MAREDPGHVVGLSPVDLAEPAALSQPLRWTSLVLLLAALLLALLNAHALRGWAYQLPPGPVAARVIGAAEAWHDSVDAAGLNRPGAALRSWWQQLRAARFDDQAVAASPERSRSA